MNKFSMFFAKISEFDKFSKMSKFFLSIHTAEFVTLMWRMNRPSFCTYEKNEWTDDWWQALPDEVDNRLARWGGLEEGRGLIRQQSEPMVRRKWAVGVVEVADLDTYQYRTFGRLKVCECLIESDTLFIDLLPSSC